MGLIVAAGIFFCLIITFCEPCLGASPYVSADSAILYDRVAKEILFGKDIGKQRPPASTTKIMTGIIALEMGSMEEEVVISRNAASKGGSSLYLREREVWTLGDLLWGTMLKSGNDGAVALAEGIAGSEAFFVELMNKKAFLVGAYNTHFLNPNGLPKEGHVSTSYDLAMITDYALKNPKFAEIVSTKETVVSGKDSSWDSRLHNTNQLLGSYEGANGVKTGTTNAAGQCLVASAKRGDRQLISVVLRSGNRYADSIRLLNHGFEDYYLFKIPKGTIVGRMYFHKAVPYHANLVTTKDCAYTVPVENYHTQEKRLVLEKRELPLINLEKVGNLEIKANQQYRIPVSVAETVRKENIADSVIQVCNAVFLQ